MTSTRKALTLVALMTAALTPIQAAAQTDLRGVTPATTLSLPVKVTNTTAIPVTPQGVTTVDGGVDVKSLPPVHVESIPPIGIDPLNNVVRLGNSADNPVLVRNVDGRGATDVVSTSARVVYDGVVAQGTILTVPLGKRLVIEHISGGSTLPAGQAIRQWTLFVNTSRGATNIAETIVPQLVAPTVTFEATWAFNHQTRLYFEPGEVVGFSVIRDSDFTPNLAPPAYISMNGYFIPIHE